MEEQIVPSDFSNFKGVWIPANIFFNRDLTRLERDLLVDIFYLASNERGCVKSNAAFAAWHGVGASAVVKAITSLRKKGYVSTKSFNGRRRELVADPGKFFGVCVGKNSYAGQDKIPTQHRKKFLQPKDENSAEDMQGEQLRLPREAGKYTEERNSRRTVAPSAPPASPAAEDSASQSWAAAPEPPEGTDENNTPEKKANRFLREFKTWGKTVGLPVSVSDSDQAAVLRFFQKNEDYQVQWLVAIMLGAWLMDPEAVDPANEDRQKYWYCAKKGRRVYTLMKHLTEIQDEIGWTGSETQIQKVLTAANARFVVRGQKLV